MMNILVKHTKLSINPAVQQMDKKSNKWNLSFSYAVFSNFSIVLYL